MFFSEPAFTPILIAQLLSFAALITSLTRSADPMLPGLILKHDAPAFAGLDTPFVVKMNVGDYRH